MGEIGFGGTGAVVDDLAEPAAAEAVHKSERQLCDMFRQCQTEIGRDTERRQMGAHQGTDVDKIRQDCEQHRHHTGMHKLCRPREIRRRVQDLPDDLPDVPERHESHKRTHRGKEPRRVGEESMPARVVHQSL